MTEFQRYRSLRTMRTGSPRDARLSAELDSRVNASRGAARAALRKAGLRHQIVTFFDVDHAFFNPRGSRYDAETATAAYRRVLAWFGRYVSS